MAENLYAVIRVRGSAKRSREIEHTLSLLKLKRPNHCVIYEESPSIKGMLKKAEPYITWGEIEKEMLKKLIEKRHPDKEKRKQAEPRKDFYKNVVFRLTPPSKGYKPVKYIYPKGACGYRGKDINNLLKRMI